MKALCVYIYTYIYERAAWPGPGCKQRGLPVEVGEGRRVGAGDV
jgi:hypothetical protein